MNIKGIIKSYLALKKFKACQSFGSSLQLSYFSHSSDGLIKNNHTFHLQTIQNKFGFLQEPNRPQLIFQEADGGVISFGNSNFSKKLNGLHGKTLGPQNFGRAVFSKDRRMIAYIARVDKKGNSKKILQEEEQLEYFRDHYGETLENVKQIGLFLADLKAQTIQRILLQDGAVPAFPSFSQDSLLFQTTTFNNKTPAGLVYCFNRPSQILSYNLAHKQLKTLTKIQSCNFPALSPDGSKLVYLSRQSQRGHCFYSSLRCQQLATGEDRQVIPVIYQNKIRKGQKHFNGITTDLQQPPTWISNQHLLIGGLVAQNKGIFKISVEKGSVQLLTKFERASQQWQILEWNKEREELLATRKHGGRLPQFCYASLSQSSPKFKFVSPDEYSLEVVEQEFYQPYSLLIYSKSEDLPPPTLRPTVVFLHGGPHGQHDHTLTMLKFTLLKAGYKLLFVSTTGGLGFGDDFAQTAIGKLTLITPQQVIASIKKAVPDEKVYLLGGSYGGYLSGWLASRHPQHFKAAVLLNPVVDLPYMFQSTDIPQWVLAQSLNAPKDSQLTSESIVQLFKDSLTGKPLGVPSLIVLGEKDRRVPFRAAVRYSQRSKQSRVLLLSQGHRIVQVQNQVRVCLATMQLFENSKGK